MSNFTSFTTHPSPLSPFPHLSAIIAAMRAFVLSGGGNRGPLEVGAIRALLQAGIVPDMVVGTSAGALNGAYLAVEPSLAQVERVADLWRDAGRRKLLQSSTASMLARMLRGHDFFTDTKRLRDYVRQVLPATVQTFGDLTLPLWVTISHLVTHTLYVYGDDLTAPLVDAILLSAAVPGFFPPLLLNDELFVDGGVTSNMPVLLAIARGATEIWAIDLAFTKDRTKKVRGGFNIAGYPLRVLLYQDVLRELEHAANVCLRTPGMTLHHIPLYAYDTVGLGDFSKTEDMVLEGERATRTYLRQPKPNEVQYAPALKPEEMPVGPRGSRPFVFEGS